MIMWDVHFKNIEKINNINISLFSFCLHQSHLWHLSLPWIFPACPTYPLCPPCSPPSCLLSSLRELPPSCPFPPLLLPLRWQSRRRCLPSPPPNPHSPLRPPPQMPRIHPRPRRWHRRRNQEKQDICCHQTKTHMQFLSFSHLSLCFSLFIWPRGDRQTAALVHTQRSVGVLQCGAMKDEWIWRMEDGCSFILRHGASPGCCMRKTRSALCMQLSLHLCSYKAKNYLGYPAFWSGNSHIHFFLYKLYVKGPGQLNRILLNYRHSFVNKEVQTTVQSI